MQQPSRLNGTKWMMRRAIRGMPPVACGIFVFEPDLDDGASGVGASVIEKGDSSSNATSGVLAGFEGAGAGANAAAGVGMSTISICGTLGARVAAGMSSSTTDTASGAVSSTISRLTISSSRLSLTPALPPATLILRGMSFFWLPLPTMWMVAWSVGGHGEGTRMVMGTVALLPESLVLPISTHDSLQVAQP